MAQSEARAGDYAGAMRLYSQLMAEEPGNVDYIFGYAQALYWSGRSDEAIRYLEQARKLAPDYEAVWKLEYRARLESGSAQSADEDFRQMASRRFPGAEWLRVDAEPPAPRYRWRLTGRLDALDNDSQDWREFGATLGGDLSDDSRWSVFANSAERFGVRDLAIGVAAEWLIDDRWIVAPGVSASSTKQILPGRAYEMVLGRKFDRGWVLSVNMRQRDYGSQVVRQAGFVAERYAGEYRFAYGLSNAQLLSDNALVHTIAVDRFGRSGSRMGLTASRGTEIEAVSADNLARTGIWSFALHGQRPLNRFLAFGWTLGIHEQGDLYRRKFVEVSVSGGY